MRSIDSAVYLCTQALYSRDNFGVSPTELQNKINNTKSEEWWKLSSFTSSSSNDIQHHQRSAFPPFLVRLDGHRFSTFTRFFRKPYDTRSTYLFPLLLSSHPLPLFAFSVSPLVAFSHIFF